MDGMITRPFHVVWFVALTLLCPAIGAAKCGTGNPPSYSDISAVMLTRYQGFWAAYKGYRAKTFDDSAFWALFWFGATYSQYDLDYQVGFYKLRVTLKDAIAVLRKDNFFALSPEDVLVTDTAKEVLSVKRCNVITKIPMLEWGGEGSDAATIKLFADLRALIQNSRKLKLSPRPRGLDGLILFEPDSY